MAVRATHADVANDAITTVDAREHFADLVNRAAYGKERVVLTRRARSVAAVVPIEDLELLRELEDRYDNELADAALAAGGRRVPLDTVLARYGVKR